tara:strand:- start:19036 stop:21138 length:2103 start_codon:yes stop_codon:yes gene_type:complete
MKTEDRDKMAIPGKPDVSELCREYKRAEGYNEIRTRTKEADHLRFDFWTGQSEDGRKYSKNYGKDVFPWEGSSDTRTRFIDTICRYLVNMMISSFQQAQIMPAGNPVYQKEASSCTKYLNWLFFSALYPEMCKEIELHGSYAAQYGWSVLFCGWDRQWTMEPREVRLETILGMLQEGGAEDFNPELEDPIDYLRERIDYLAPMLAATGGIPEKEAKEKLQELVDSGLTTFPVKVPAKDDPYLVALRPYYDVLFPPETDDLQNARVIFRRDWISEAELLRRAEVEYWNADFVESMITSGKKLRPFHQDDFSPAFGDWGSIADTDENMMEIVYCYRRVVQEDGTTAIYMTIINPNQEKDQYGKEIYAKDCLVSGVGDRYPFREFCMEHVRREITDSRGVTHVCRTWAYELKAQFDSVVDRTSFDVLPALLTNPRYDRVEIGPAAQIPIHRDGDIQFLEPPRREPTMAFMVMEALNERADRYYGRPNPKVDPSETLMTQQAFVNRWMSHLSSVVQMVWDMVEAFGDDNRFNQVTGVDTGIPRDPLNAKFWMHFDVTRLNPELMTKKLEAISQFILPEDMTGAVNRTKLTEFKLDAIDPVLSKLVMMSDAEASQKLFDDVNLQIAQMFLGNKPKLVELDPAAGVKLQMAEDIIKANPKYQKAIQEDQIFQQLLEIFFQNLNMSITQEQNKQVGRVGVDPNVQVK